MKKPRTHWWIIVSKKTGEANYHGPLFTTRKQARTRIKHYKMYDSKVIKVILEPESSKIVDRIKRSGAWKDMVNT